MNRLLVVIFAVLGPVVAFAADVEHHFLRILEPREQDKYSVNMSNIGGMGYFCFPDKERRAEDLRIRIRIYRPVNGDFELCQEQDAEIGKPFPNEPATLQYIINLKRKQPLKPGKYLYRADCFERTGKEEKLLASDSAFMTFVELEKPPGVQAHRARGSGIRHAEQATVRLEQVAVKSK